MPPSSAPDALASATTSSPAVEAGGLSVAAPHAPIAPTMPIESAPSPRVATPSAAGPADAALVPPGLPVVTEMSKTASGRTWLAGLPALIGEFRDRWSLRLGPPIHGGSCSWVAPATLPGGGAAVLKLTWPHREASGEAAGLRSWDGNGAVRLLAADSGRYALLVERCTPGIELGDAAHVPTEARLTAAAELLNGLWSAPPPTNSGLERVAAVASEWARQVEERMTRLTPGYDPALVAIGVKLLRTLPGTAMREVVVHGDLNPGNVLAAGRRPWLAIDPKPMVGDPAYDAWPLLTQLDEPFELADPRPVLADRYALVADVVGEDARRLLAWSVARAVESALWFAAMGEIADGAEEMAQARTLAGLAGL
ncbi:aminoglycoside phosphotransferase family protein [Streptomyces zagrosensis]|uniref:Streptomycin 6-kinase n=1 Tax=Streptomyces zagrosensis TaxID=1042984 RepID=A0A7W9V077_9ACTN|nr:aminoglycoside phosphotransferase family protein [Streptomyces zagrosensis]MBB5937848.1 streptomycin 6-kinase [Streptomyces zagrosensis]